MSDAHDCWRKVDDLLKAAATSSGVAERTRLIDQAVFWRTKAVQLERAKTHMDREGVVPFAPIRPADGSED